MNDALAKAGSGSKLPWQRLAAAVLLVIVAAIAFWALPLVHWLELSEAWVDDHPLSGRVLFVLTFIATAVVLVPGSLLTMLGGYFFGFSGGVIIVWFSVGFAAAATAMASRYIARPWLTRRFQHDPRFVAIDNAIADKALTVVLLCRLSLLIPFNFLNLIFGLTRMPVTTVMFGTWLGMLPAVALYVYFGAAANNVRHLVAGDLDTGAAGQAMFIVGLLSVVVVTYIIHSKATIALRRELGDDDGVRHDG